MGIWWKADSYLSIDIPLNTICLTFSIEITGGYWVLEQTFPNGAEYVLEV